MSKTVVLRMNTQQLMNLENGLGLLHSKMVDRYNDVHPKDERASDLKGFYKEKVEEIAQQIKICKQALEVE